METYVLLVITKRGKAVDYNVYGPSPDRSLLRQVGASMERKSGVSYHIVRVQPIPV